MTTVFKQIDDWINGNPAPDGWASLHLCQTLASITFALRPERCVEIGVFGGRSLIPIALALKEIGRGTIIGIDPWDAVASVEGQNAADAEWWSNKKMHTDVYTRFMQNLQTFRLQNIVKIERKRSDAVTPPEGIELLVVDGNHGPQAMVDIKRFTPKVVIGGFCFCDDLNWEGGNVAAGVEWMKKNGFDQKYTIGGGAMLQRTKA